MSKKKRVTLVSLACLLVVGLLVGGTLAWLTDTDAVENKIKIATIGTTPEEPNWPKPTIPPDPDSTKPPEDPTATIPPIPGATVPPVPVYPGVPQAKDPTVEIDADSEPVYVRAIVKISKAMYNALEGANSVTFKTDLTGAALPNCNTGWTQSTMEENGDYYYLQYRYSAQLSNDSDATKTTTPVFTGFQLKSTVTAADLENVDMNITIKSQAIQAAGFTDADTALANLGAAVSAFGITPPEPESESPAGE